MKIGLYLAYTLGSAGGNQRMLLEIASRLAKKGHAITVISGKDPKCDMAGQYDLDYKAFDYIHGDKVAFLDNALRMIQPKSGILNNPTGKIFEAVSFFRNARSFIAKEKFDAIILFKAIDALLFKEIKKKCPKTRLYIYIGGPYILPLKLEKRSVEHLDGVIGLSYAVSKDTERKTGKKCITIHSGTDFEKFRKDDKSRKEYRRKLGLGNDFVLMSVARLVEWKGIHIALKALQGIRQARYIIVGEGPFEGEIDRLIGELGLKKNVIRIPKHTQEELLGFYNASDLFLQPSIGFEGLGIKLSDYEGPASVTTYLTTRAKDEGIEMVALMATVPAYVQGANPKCIAAVTRRIAGILGLHLDLEDLQATADEFERRLTEVVQEQPELAESVTKLEQDYDNEIFSEMGDLKNWLHQKGIRLD